MSGGPAAPGDQRPDGGAQEPTESRKSKIENPNDDERSTRTYPCRFCEKIFKKLQALGGHMNKHRGPEREKEAYENAQALLNNRQQLPGSHNSNPSFGGGMATEIAQVPSAPSGMTNPGLALGAWPLNIPAAYYYEQTGLAHFNMPVSSLPNLNPMIQSNNSINHMQQIPSNSRWNEDNNMDSNVPQAHFNMSVPSSPTLDSLMESDSWGIHLQQIPGTSHWNEDNNMMDSNVPRAHLNMSVPSSSTLDSLMKYDSWGIHLQQIPNNLGWNEDNNMMDSNVPRLNMSIPSSPTLESSLMESDSWGIHLQQIPGNSHWNEENSNVPQATSALENEPTLR